MVFEPRDRAAHGFINKTNNNKLTNNECIELHERRNVNRKTYCYFWPKMQTLPIFFLEYQFNCIHFQFLGASIDI